MLRRQRCRPSRCREVLYSSREGKSERLLHIMRVPDRLPTILVLGTTQTLAWASSYYLPAILGDAIAQDLNIPSQWLFGAFSTSLLVAAVLGPRIGRTI